VQSHAGERSYIYTMVAMSPNGRFVASVDRVGTENWKLWDAASGAERMVGARHDGTGACICEVDDLGHRVLQEVCPVAAHTAKICALAFSRCGQMLASGDCDGVVILWIAQTGEAERRMQAGREAIYSLAFSVDGVRLACDRGDGSVYVLDTTTGALLCRLSEWEDNVSAPPSDWVQFSPVNKFILATIAINRITLWDVDSGKKTMNFAGTNFAVFSPDGRTIATASASVGSGSDVHLLDVETGVLRLRLTGHRRSVCSVSFSIDDGSKLASVSWDGACKVWDSSTGDLLSTINVNTSITSVSWGRDWVRDTEGAMAFAMGYHPRLGARSEVLALDAGVVQMILDRV